MHMTVYIGAYVKAMELLVATTMGWADISSSNICSEIVEFKSVGKGEYGLVFTADTNYKNRKNPAFVVKLFAGDEAKQNFQDEYSILKRLEEEANRSNLSTTSRLFPILYGHCYDYRFHPQYEIITDFVRNDFLHKGRRFYSDMMNIHGLIEAVRQIHWLGFVHLDLKPENVRISAEGVVKLIDFGLSEQYSDSSNASEVLVGTLPYMPPEVLIRKLIPSYEKPKLDVWCIGSIAYRVLTDKDLRDDSCLITMKQCLFEKVGRKYDLTVDGLLIATYKQTKVALEGQAQSSPADIDFFTSDYMPMEAKADKLATKCVEKCKFKSPQTYLEVMVRKRIKRDHQYNGHNMDIVIKKTVSLVLEELLQFFPHNRATTYEALDVSQSLKQLLQKFEK